MEIKTFAQLDKLVKDYKFVCLCDSEGSQLVNYNNATTAMQKRLQQIKKRLESPALSDGIYIIKCKDAIKGQKADEIIYVKGEGTAAASPAGPTPVAKTKDTAEPAVLTYAEAIRLNSEIKRLEYEVLTLQTENALLKKDLEAAESDLDELNTAAVAKLSEGAPNKLTEIGTTLKELLPSVTALFDTHFQLKERELKIKENQRQQPAAPLQAPINAPDIPENAFILDENEQSILNYFEALKTGNPEQYNKIYDSMQAEMQAADKGEQGE